MAEDQSSREILKEIVERLDLLERVLGTNTARLHNIEQHVGVVPQPQAWDDAGTERNGETPLTTTVRGSQPNAGEGACGPSIDSTGLPKSPEETWAQTETELTPSAMGDTSVISKRAKPTAAHSAHHDESSPQKWEQPETPPPDTPATHSWINEGSPSRRYATIEEALWGDRPPSADDPLLLADDRHGHADDREGHTDYSHGRADDRHIHADTEETEEDTEQPETKRLGKRRDLESMVAGSWFTWIGIIAVTFGVAFFLKFAFDQQWIGPSARVSLSAFVGASLLYVGERLRRRDLRSYAYVLSGGGLLILYLSVYAAYSLYHLIGHTPALLLMIAVTTTAVLLSVRLNALPVAILGLVGGFLTPVLLSTGVDNEVGLFTYVALLDTGVLAVAYFKRWRSLDFLSFAGTLAMTLGWAVTFFSPDKVWTTLFFLSVFFLLYSLLPIFHNVLRNRPSRWFDVLLAIANATLYFGASYLMLVETGFDHATPATLALLLSIFFTGLFYTTWRWNSDDRLLRYNYLGAAATFLSVAVSIQLELHWVTIAWAVEALMLTWVGLRLRETGARHAALGVFCAAVVHWFVWDMPVFALNVDPSFVPLLNRRALSCAVLVAAIACAARLYRRAPEIDEDERSTVKTLFLLTGNAVALTLLSVDTNDYFTARLAGSAPDQTNLLAQIENSRQFSISMLWTLYAATMLALGLLRRSKLLRWGGLVLLVAAIAKIVVIDSTYYAASWHFPVFNQTFMAYAVLVAVLAFAARLYRRPANVDESERRVMLPSLLIGANLLALAAFSLEVFGYYDRLLTSGALAGQSLEIASQLHEARIFMLMLVWTLYATGEFLFGAWRRSPAWRYGGLLLLAVTTPLVLLSLSFYDASWHVLVFNRTLASFAIFIAVLWLIVRIYARSGEAFEEAHIARPVATVAANVLAIVALSAQASGYFDAKIFAELSRTAAAATGVNGLEGQRNLELAKQLSLSVVWALYAVGLLVAGRVRRLLRVMGLALLSLTTLKVFLIDLSSLERAYRIISFIMLGAILLVVSYFYQRSQQRAEVKES